MGGGGKEEKERGKEKWEGEKELKSIKKKQSPKGPGQSLDIIREIKTFKWNKTQSEIFPRCVHMCMCLCCLGVKVVPKDPSRKYNSLFSSTFVPIHW